MPTLGSRDASLYSLPWKTKEAKLLFICLLAYLGCFPPVLRVEPMVSQMLGKGFSPRLHLQPEKIANCLMLLISPCAQTD